MALQCHLRTVGYCSNASCYYESQLQLSISCKFYITSANLWLMSLRPWGIHLTWNLAVLRGYQVNFCYLKWDLVYLVHRWSPLFWYLQPESCPICLVANLHISLGAALRNYTVWICVPTSRRPNIGHWSQGREAGSRTVERSYHGLAHSSWLLSVQLCESWALGQCWPTWGWPAG